MLDFKVNKNKLREVFCLAGKIVKLNIPTDEDKNSRGFAIIQYEHPVEAVQAISMFHNQSLYGRTMTVRMHRKQRDRMFKLPKGLKDIGLGLGIDGDPLRNVAYKLRSIKCPPTQRPGGGAGAGGVCTNLLANSLGGGGGDLGHTSFVQNKPLPALFRSENLGISLSDWHYFGGSRRFDNQNGLNFGYGSDREGRMGNQNVYSGLVSNGTTDGGKGSDHPFRILITDVPGDISYKMVFDRCNDFGDVLLFEEKFSSVSVTYAEKWEAEIAVSSRSLSFYTCLMQDSVLFWLLMVPYHRYWMSIE